jgi:hypothetical protein
VRIGAGRAYTSCNGGPLGFLGCCTAGTSDANGVVASPVAVTGKVVVVVSAMASFYFMIAWTNASAALSRADIFNIIHVLRRCSDTVVVYYLSNHREVLKLPAQKYL